MVTFCTLCELPRSTTHHGPGSDSVVEHSGISVVSSPSKMHASESINTHMYYVRKAMAGP